MLNVAVTEDRWEWLRGVFLVDPYELEICRRRCGKVECDWDQCISN